MDSNRGYNLYKWVTGPLTRVINLSDITFYTPVVFQIIFWVRYDRSSSEVWFLSRPLLAQPRRFFQDFGRHFSRLHLRDGPLKNPPKKKVFFVAFNIPFFCCAADLMGVFASSYLRWEVEETPQYYLEGDRWMWRWDGEVWVWEEVRF